MKLWRELKPGDVVHREGLESESYLVIDGRSGLVDWYVVVPLMSLDTGEVYYEHYKSADAAIEWPWTI